MQTIYEGEAVSGRLKAALAEFAAYHFNSVHLADAQIIKVSVLLTDYLTFEYSHEADGFPLSGGSL